MTEEDTKKKAKQAKKPKLDQAAIDQQVNELFAIHREDPPKVVDRWLLIAITFGVLIAVTLVAVISLP